MDALKFTIPEIFSFIGVVQCVFILVYMLFRAGRLSRATIPFFYFLVLGMAFFLDFSDRFISDISPYFEIIKMALWFAGPPIAVLVVIQIAQIKKVPALKHYWVLALPFISYLAAHYNSRNFTECNAVYNCPEFLNWFVIISLIIGAICLLYILMQQKILSSLLEERNNQERYWLVLTIVISNIFLLLSMFGYLQDKYDVSDIVLVRTFLGLAFVYLVTTSLFRIYPQAVEENKPSNDALTPEEVKVAHKIENLLELDKIYHEPSYSRTDLSRELGISEMQTSKIINQHFQGSFPQIMNKLRIEDAKRFLTDTDENISVISKEVGFNSLATFNRVFKEFEGVSPSQFRSNKKNI